MTIILNGEPTDVVPGSSVAQLLVQLNLHPDRLAVIVNGLVVRKASHDETTLVDHDTVDIITMVGGG